MTCLITGTARLPNGVVLPGAVFTFKRSPYVVAPKEGAVEVPQAITVTADGSGVVSFSLQFGVYSGMEMSTGVRFSYSVPDVASMDFIDGFGPVADAPTVPSYPAFQVGMIGGGTVQDYAGFSTRAVFVAWAAGKTPAEGSRMDAAGLSYRYTGSGTVIADLPGWVSDGPAHPGHHGAAGDGTTNDTTAVYSWLMQGGGEAPDQSKTYMINPMIITVTVNVTNVRATFKQRSGWTDWTAITGVIELRAGGTWLMAGGWLDGNRDDTAVNAGMTAILGTNNGNSITNRYKAFLYIACLTGSVTINIDGIQAKNCIGHGVNIVASNGAKISGRVGTIRVQDSAAVIRMDRCQNLTVEALYGYNIDNRVGGNNEYFFPFNNNAIIVIRCTNCPINYVSMNKHRGRPGNWLPAGGAGAGDLFITSVTISSCVNSPMRTVYVNDVLLVMEASTDTAPDSVASRTANIGFSDVGNIDCEFTRLDVIGTFAQHFECIPGKPAVYGTAVLRSNHGEQGTGSGSVGLNCHGAARYQYNAGTGVVARAYPVHIAVLDIEGGHYGVRSRANELSIGTLRVHGCRADAVLVSDLGIKEWANGPALVPSITIDDCDIRFNGRNGVRVVNGGEIRIRRGRISDNCQMSGYDDPTYSGGAFTATQGVYYDSADTYSGAVSKIILGDVDTTNLASYSFPSSGASYLPRALETGSYSTIPDAAVKVMAMTWKDMKLPNIGQRFQIQNVDVGGTQDVDVWVRDIIGNAVLVEVSNAGFTGAWSDAVQTIALTGTWTIAAGATPATGVGGILWTEMQFPAFIKTSGGYVLLENALTTTTFNIQSDTTWGATFERTLTTAIAAEALSYVQVGFTYTQRQTVRAAIIHVNVAFTQDSQPITVDGVQTLTNKTIDLSQNTVVGAVTPSGVQTLTNKTIDVAQNTLVGLDLPEFCLLTAPYVLTSTTAMQKLLNGSANGALTLQVGFYSYDGMFSLSAMDAAAASNLQFSILGAGTAAITEKMMRYLGHEAALGGVTTTTGGLSNSLTSPASLVTGSANATLQFDVRGVIHVFTAGTIIPSVALAVAAPAAVAANSYFRATRVSLAALSAGWT